jgi:hypothetical protein
LCECFFFLGALDLTDSQEWEEELEVEEDLEYLDFFRDFDLDPE